MGFGSRAAWLIVALSGCSADDVPESPPPSECPPPNRSVGDRCVEPGVQDDGCPAGTLGLEDGSCQPAGIPPELCGDGFEPDGDMSCEPVLPPAPCPAGQMAVPGESVCRSVMPCGAGKWGDIPVDATTVYVDAFYQGVDSDGSSVKPFTTISDAIAAAASGALIAVAAGSYLEDVDVNGNAVRLWGKCPSEVELVGTGAALAALVIRQGASATEVHGIRLGGSAAGLGVSGAEDVLVDRVWVHDARARGITVESTLGPTSITVGGSLIEANHDVGVFVMGSDATLENVVVRGTLPRVSDNVFGRGISFQLACTGACDIGARAIGRVRGAVIEGNRDAGVFVMGSDATLENVVIRDTLPQASDQRFGRGITVQRYCTAGVCDAAARATALVRGSLVQGNHELGMVVAGSDATLEGVVVRGTLPQASDQRGGSGVSIQLSCDPVGCVTTARSTAVVRGARVEDNRDAGVVVAGSDTTLEGLLVRGTLPQVFDQLGGRGISLQLGCGSVVCDAATRSTAIVRGSIVEESYDVGVFVGATDATLEGLLVRSTVVRQGDGLYGDGVSVVSYQSALATSTITGTRIEASARAGLANFGGSVLLGASKLACNGFDLEGEKVLDQPFTFQTLGNNACGCSNQSDTCKVQSAGLVAPEPLSQNTQ